MSNTVRRFIYEQTKAGYVVKDQQTGKYYGGAYFSWWHRYEPQVKVYEDESKAKKIADELEMLWTVELPDLPKPELVQFMARTELRILRELTSGHFQQTDYEVFKIIYRWIIRLQTIKFLHDLSINLSIESEWAWQFTTFNLGAESE